ncbi:N-alpha-acetyltransferase 50 [Bonamia ostreae]|uniref:N-alpha-acetyltransferase 50 n=1 Tax=Bonamia ostreae TaxID=126728 RepID=A0ABV2AI54_9EUKA
MILVYLKGDDAELIGTATARVENGRIGYIATIGVNSKYRKRGIGQNLLKILEEDLVLVHKVEKIYLHVHIENDGALYFYKKRGYRITKRIPNLYKFVNRDERQDAFELEKKTVTRNCELL